MRLKRSLAVVFLFALSLPAVAKEINLIQLLNQSEFRALSEDLGAALQQTYRLRRRLADLVGSGRFRSRRGQRPHAGQHSNQETVRP